MIVETATWKGRHKRISRRLHFDLRAILPVLFVFMCFTLSATVILAAEQSAF